MKTLSRQVGCASHTQKKLLKEYRFKLYYANVMKKFEEGVEK